MNSIKVIHWKENKSIADIMDSLFLFFQTAVSHRHNGTNKCHPKLKVGKKNESKKKREKKKKEIKSTQSESNENRNKIWAKPMPYMCSGFDSN